MTSGLPVTLPRTVSDPVEARLGFDFLVRCKLGFGNEPSRLSGHRTPNPHCGGIGYSTCPGVGIRISTLRSRRSCRTSSGTITFSRPRLCLGAAGGGSDSVERSLLRRIDTTYLRPHRPLQPSAERFRLSAPRRRSLSGEERRRGSVARGVAWSFPWCSCSCEGVLWCGGPSVHVGSSGLP